MKTFGVPPLPPLRRGLIDPRSSNASAVAGAMARKPLLNDRRSTR